MFKKSVRGAVGAIEIVLIIVVLAVAGLVVWRVTTTEQESTDTDTATTEETSTQGTEDEVVTTIPTAESELRFRYQGYPNDNKILVSIEHPETWIANLTVWDGDETKNPRNELELISPSNYRISINDADGIGYMCDNTTATVVHYTVEDIIITNTDFFNFYYITADNYLTNDSEDVYLPINDLMWDGSPDPIASLGVSDTFSKVYTDTGEEGQCTPLEGPQLVSLPNNGSLNIVVEGPGSSHDMLFSSGFDANFITEVPELRSILESITISIDD